MINIIKRELKLNIRQLIIFSLITASFLLLMDFMFPVVQKMAPQMDEVMAQFSDSFLAAFNMDDLGFDTITSFFGTEGYLYVNLILGAYGAILGSSILLKEKADKTFEYLMTKPVSRKDIYFGKLISGFLNVLAISLVVFVINLIAFSIVDVLDIKALLLLTLGTFLLTLLIYMFSFFMALFAKKTRDAMGMGMGLLFGSYLLFIISLVSDKIDFLKYFSLFYYIDSTPLIKDHSFNIFYIVGALIIMGALKYFGFVVYKKQDFS